VEPRAGLDAVAKKKSMPLPGIERRSSSPWLSSEVKSKCFGVMEASYPVGTRCSFPESEAAGA
jgi:hypothetical protein